MNGGFKLTWLAKNLKIDGIFYLVYFPYSISYKRTENGE